MDVQLISFSYEGIDTFYFEIDIGETIHLPESGTVLYAKVTRQLLRIVRTYELFIEFMTAHLDARLVELRLLVDGHLMQWDFTHKGSGATFYAKARKVEDEEC